MIKDIKLITSTSNNIHKNLALEEYLLGKTGNYLLFYRNNTAVVLGKHQNPWKEVNLHFCISNHIPVVRRMSGGGTVFHDINNINFSYIRTKDKDFVNFREHIEPISEALAEMGIPNWITARNDIFIEDAKISGNAEHFNSRSKRIIHHGTLLFDADLAVLRATLNPELLAIKTHAVNSVRSKVRNILDLSTITESSIFMETIINLLSNKFDSSPQLIEPDGIKEVDVLSNEKYANWDWNFGHSPQFNFTNHNEEIITVRKGKIIEIDSDLINETDKKSLIGLPISKSQLAIDLPINLLSLANRLCLI